MAEWADIVQQCENIYRERNISDACDLLADIMFGEVECPEATECCGLSDALVDLADFHGDAEEWWGTVDTAFSCAAGKFGM